MEVLVVYGCEDSEGAVPSVAVDEPSAVKSPFSSSTSPRPRSASWSGCSRQEGPSSTDRLARIEGKAHVGKRTRRPRANGHVRARVVRDGAIGPFDLGQSDISRA
jgi:hypothetical protein